MLVRKGARRCKCRKVELSNRGEIALGILNLDKSTVGGHGGTSCGFLYKTALFKFCIFGVRSHNVKS